MKHEAEILAEDLAQSRIHTIATKARRNVYDDADLPSTQNPCDILDTNNRSPHCIANANS